MQREVLHLHGELERLMPELRDGLSNRQRDLVRRSLPDWRVLERHQLPHVRHQLLELHRAGLLRLHNVFSELHELERTVCLQAWSLQ